MNNKNAEKINENKIFYNTPAGKVKIFIPYAYAHFIKKGRMGNKKENRKDINAALQIVLDNPAFVTKDKKGTMYFYKPFKDEKGIKDIISVSIDKGGTLEYKTTYKDKFKQILNMINEQEMVYKE